MKPSSRRPSTPGVPPSRREFLSTTGAFLAGAAALGPLALAGAAAEKPVLPCGPGSRYTPKVHAAFVRRKEDYGILWPGAIYDGERALREYRGQVAQAARELGLEVTLRGEPIHSAAEAAGWLEEAKAGRPDGLLVLLLDRQQHAWPTVGQAIASGLPTVVFAPVGTAFTTNTTPEAEKGRVFICSTSDFRQARYGLKMLRAAAKLREMRFVVLQGDRRREEELPFFGTKLRYLPTRTFLEEYEATPVTEEVRALSAAYLKAATHLSGPTREDLHRGLRSYVVARRILEREEGDGITMDCLGALGRTTVSLPCIAWSRMLDRGVPAACEADLGACVTHALVQFLFDRPGFQQDPVPETARHCLIGAHCTCPTRLDGFHARPAPYDLSHHHGNRDAVPRPVWREGQRVTIADVLLPRETPRQTPQLLISTGAVVENLAVPPAGGCVVSVMVKLDTQPDLLRFPGFHQLFFYGDFKNELAAYARLFGLEAVVV